MKKTNLQNVSVFFVSLLLFVSCIGEGRNAEVNETVCVVSAKDIFTNVLDLPDGRSFYSSIFANKTPGDCFWIYYELDHDDPLNSDESVLVNGYYQISLLAYDEIKSYGISYEVTDTTTVLNGEVAILEAIANEWYSYVKGMFFVVSALNIPSDQEVYWDLSCDMDNVVAEEYLGQRVYNVYLRSQVYSSSTESSKDVGMYNAFNMRFFLEKVAQEEKKLGRSSFKLCFNYVSEIKDEKLTWAKQYSSNILVDYIFPVE